MRRIEQHIGILIFIFISSFNLMSQVITLDGYIFLEGKSDHSNIQVLIERTAPFAIYDTIYSNSSGYFSKDIQSGMYNITYHKNNYYEKNLIDVNCYSNYTLASNTLIFSSSLIKVPESISSIQEAINVANANDTILVSTGIYYENINYNGKEILVTSNFLFSGDTADINNTIIDGNGIASVVIFENGENSNAILNGFSIRNGCACDADYPGYFGGGIRCYASPTLKNLKIYNNEANYGGGGIYSYGSTSNLKNIQVYNNFAGRNGGGIELYNANTNLDNILVYNNTAGTSGGGIWCRDNTTIIRNSTVCFNTVNAHDDYTSGGAGFYLFNSNTSIHNSIISNNNGSEGVHVAFGDSPLINYSNVWENEKGNFYQCNPSYGINLTINSNRDSCDGFYNIELDPEFLDVSKNNYKLKCESPCVDAGSNVYVLDSIDIIVDIGAFETIGFLVEDILNICQGDTLIWREKEFTKSGAYYDSLITINGCDSIYKLNLTINSNDLFEIESDVCYGDIFSWHDKDYTESGTYFDSLLSVNGCDSIYSLTLNVITTDTSVTLTNNTLTAIAAESVSYSWYNCSTQELISGENNQSISPSENGNYALIIEKNGCIDTSSCYQIINTSINTGMASLSGIVVYPNPVDEILSIKDHDIQQIVIYNINGQILLIRKYENVDEVQVNMSNFDSGSYLLQIVSKGKMKSELIIVE